MAAVAGRGTIYITAAKLYFIVSGYAIYFVLPRLVSPAEFGVYGFVTGAVAVINAVIVAGTQQAVSKFIAEDPRRAQAIKRLALRVQAVVGLIITGGYFAAIPLIARLVGDPAITFPLQLATLIPLAYTFYAVYIGYLNGQKRFLEQAILDITYSTLKAGLIVALAIAFHSINGAIAGFGLAAVVVLIIASLIIRPPADQINLAPTAAAFWKFQTAVFGFTLVNNLLQRIDLFLLKALGAASSTTANELAGYYTALMAVANLTYQAIISVAAVIFPLVARATAESQWDLIREYLSQAVKYTLIIMALAATLISANASEVLRLLYREAYAQGAPALAIVAYGMLFLGLFSIFAAVISSSGRPKNSLSISVITLLISGGLNLALIPVRGMTGAAIATSLAMFLGTIISGGYLHYQYGKFWTGKTLLTIMLAVGLTYTVKLGVLSSPLLSQKLYNLVLIMSLQSGVYFVVLWALREVGRKEWQLLQKMLPQSKF
jgi:stage V sporulation protein B